MNTPEDDTAPTLQRRMADPAPRDPGAAAGDDPLIGQTLGDYVISERLGQGGMGLVYRGEQPMIGKRVAIKVLRPEIARDPEQVQRLLAEARAVNAIRHRGIIDIFNFGQLPDGRHYVVMEYLAGRALDELISQKGALPPHEALVLLDEVLAALGAGHEAGIIHRDLKPSNIYLVSQPDGSRYVKLLDFGLSKQSAAPRAATPQTRTDMFVGTPEYVAPEQARAEAVGPYTDLYAAGVVAFEMLTGHLPFSANTPIDWVIQHLETLPPRPSEKVGGIPPELDALVLRLLEKDPKKRPESADVVRRELARILRQLSNHATPAAPLPVPPLPSAKPPPLPAGRASLALAVRRSRTPFYAGGAAVLVLAAGALGYALWPSAKVAPSAATLPAAPPPAVSSFTPAAPAAEPESAPERELEAAPEPEPVAAKAAPPAAPARVKPARTLAREPRDIPSKRELARRIDRLDKLIREQAQGEAPPETALVLLKTYRDEAVRAQTAPDRRELAHKLQLFEQHFRLQR